MPLFFILLGIIQFGFVFNSFVTITNAAREAARYGTVYMYDSGLSRPRTISPATSDQDRAVWPR